MVICNGHGQVFLVGGGVAVRGRFDIESLALGRGEEESDALFGHDSRSSNKTRCCEGVELDFLVAGLRRPPAATKSQGESAY